VTLHIPRQLYPQSGAKLAPFNWGGGVSARIALPKPMMPCSKFLFAKKIFRTQTSKIEDQKHFFGQIPVKTWVEPLFLHQYL
jgi:hypothetical protein